MINRGTIFGFILLLSLSSYGLTPTQPLPGVRVELRIDDKSFPEMARIYTTEAKKQYRATKLADTAGKIARSFQAIHPFVIWTGTPDAPARGVFIAAISESDHAVSAQWTFYPKTGTGNVGTPCVIYSRFENNRHLQDPAEFGEDVIKATRVCTGASGLDLDGLPPFHATLRTALKNLEIAHSIDAIDDTHVYLPLQWSAFYPAQDSIFRVDYWSDYKGKRTHGIVFLGNADRESPEDVARVTTVPHVCDEHKVIFNPIVKSPCTCHHKDFVNAAATYKGLLQTMQTLDPNTKTAVYVEFYREDHREGTQGLVDTPDAPRTHHKGGPK